MSSGSRYDDTTLWQAVPNEIDVKAVKIQLESRNLYDRSRKITFENGTFYVPLVGSGSAPKAEDSELVNKLKKQRWSLYPPMVLFNTRCEWSEEEVKSLICDSKKYFGQVGVTHLAQNAPLIQHDVVRSPSKFTPIYGDFGPTDDIPTEEGFINAFWCSSIQNGISQIWAPRYTMFSRGNIKEKMRVKAFDNVRHCDIVDLYCGIGYFSLVYASNAPNRIFAWDINPWSIEGFLRGAKANKIKAQLLDGSQPYDPSVPSSVIYAFLEDNQKSLAYLSSLPDLFISHINMGLLPDCRKVWNLAVQLATLPTNSSPTTVLHVHENVAEKDVHEWTCEVLRQLTSYHPSPSPNIEFAHVELIKTFAPGVYHVCGDFVIHNM